MASVAATMMRRPESTKESRIDDPRHNSKRFPTLERYIQNSGSQSVFHIPPLQTQTMSIPSQQKPHKR